MISSSIADVLSVGRPDIWLESALSAKPLRANSVLGRRAAGVVQVDLVEVSSNEVEDAVAEYLAEAAAAAT